MRLFVALLCCATVADAKSVAGNGRVDGCVVPDQRVDCGYDLFFKQQ